MSITRRTALVTAAAGLAVRPARAAGAVRIGVLTDEAGPYADSGGAGSIAAARMAAQDFGPTVLGRPIEILHADTRNKPDIASAAARQWYDDGVDAITDLPVTPVALAVQRVAREKGRTVIITASAISEFTSKFCAPVSSHWAVDTHAMTTGVGRVLTGAGQKWFFITVDFSFGQLLEAEATKVVRAQGGTVLGDAKFPLGNTDFSSQIVQAQSSGASVIGLASVGGDQVNLIKQAAEFGLRQGGVTLAAFLVYITDIHAIGLKLAQGLSFPAGFYWDQNEATRAFTRRFMAERKAAPTQNQAAIYASTRHFLKAMAQAGTDDPLAVNKAMRALPVDLFAHPATMRADGRVLFDVTLWRVKTPEESQAPWDYYKPVGLVPADQAFLPISAGCA
jgi:branched-chain amino acid transport system substrate-binding protein